MVWTIRSDVADVHAQDGLTVVAFGEDGTGEPRYLNLQACETHDEQDRRNGMDRLYLEICDQSRASFGGIEAVEVDGELLLLRLDETARGRLGIDSDIAVDLMPVGMARAAVIAAVEAMAERYGVGSDRR